MGLFRYYKYYLKRWQVGKIRTNPHWLVSRFLRTSQIVVIYLNMEKYANKYSLDTTQRSCHIQSSYQVWPRFKTMQISPHVSLGGWHYSPQERFCGECRAVLTGLGASIRRARLTLHSRHFNQWTRHEGRLAWALQTSSATKRVN